MKQEKVNVITLRIGIALLSGTSKQTNIAITSRDMKKIVRTDPKPVQLLSIMNSQKFGCAV